MKLIFLLLAILAAPLTANANEIIAKPPPTHVFFFSGHGSTQAQIGEWERSVVANGFTFEGIRYPADKAGFRPAMRASPPIAQRLTMQMRKMLHDNGQQKFLLVGHSSGSVIATEVANRAPLSAVVGLLILDGFTPKPAIQALVPVVCWSAVNGKDRKLVSFNQTGMQSCPVHHEFVAKGCKTQMCLHFSLVNLNAPAKLNEKNYAKQGFAKLKPNLAWLKNLPVSVPAEKR